MRRFPPPSSSLTAAFFAATAACSAVEPGEPPRTAQATEQRAAVATNAPSSSGQIARPSACAGWALGTKVSIEDTTHGSALVFSTSGDITALRNRVAQQMASLGPTDNAHLDNVPLGIRMVFEPRDGKGTDLRENVAQRGRELTTTCGLDWNARDDEAGKQASRATPPRVEPVVPSVQPEPPTTIDKPGVVATPTGGEPKNAKDEAKAKDKAPGEAKPGDTKKPSDANKPKDGDKPKEGDKPKDPPAVPPPPPQPPVPPPPPPFKP